jgi:hypothetical protein
MNNPNPNPNVIAIISVAAFLASCATSSGVSQLGKDTYTISAGVSGSGSVSGNDTKAKRDALKEANAHCLSLGREIRVQNIGTSSTYAGSTTELIFQCLNATEAEASDKPKYRREPNIVIENRSR